MAKKKKDTKGINDAHGTTPINPVESLPPWTPPDSDDDKRSITGETGTDPNRDYDRHFNIPTPEETPNVPRDLNTLGNQIDADITWLDTKVTANSNAINTNAAKIEDNRKGIVANKKSIDDHKLDEGDALNRAKHPHTHPAEGTFPGYEEIGHTHPEYSATSHDHAYIDFTISDQAKSGRIQAGGFSTQPQSGHQGNVDMNSKDGNPPGLFLRVSDTLKVYYNAANSSKATASRGPSISYVDHYCKNLVQGRSIRELQSEIKEAASLPDFSDIDLHKIDYVGRDLNPYSLRDAGFEVTVSEGPPSYDEEGEIIESLGDEIGFALNDVVAFLVHKVQEQSREIQELKSKVK